MVNVSVVFKVGSVDKTWYRSASASADADSPRGSGAASSRACRTFNRGFSHWNSNGHKKLVTQLPIAVRPAGAAGARG